jgi:hypothetical protein
MILRLKPGHSGFAPSGMAYTDPRTGGKFDGYERSIEGAIALIIEHRKKNPRIYPANEPFHVEHSNVRQEFYRHLHSKRPDMFVTATVVNGIVATAAKEERCYSCGSTSFEEILCPTCGGHKVTGKKCTQCGTRLW